MKFLLDAHALIWFVDQDHLLSARAHAAIVSGSNDLLLSAGTIWEISIKVGLKKLALSKPFRQWMDLAIASLRLRVLPISVEHADIQMGLPQHHRDPFDRLLAAQSIAENIPLISTDAIFDSYGVARLWS